MAIAKSFVWGNGGAQLTPEEIAKQREVEDALLQRGIDTSPVGSWAEGLARVANSAAGSFRRGRLLKAEGENKAYDTDAFNKITALLSGGASPSPAPAAAPVATVPMTGASSEMKATDPVGEVLAAGSQPSGDRSWLAYDNSGATRSQPLDDKLVNALGFLPDMGVQMRVFSGGQPDAAEGGPRTGSVRHDHGGAGDVFFYKDGRKLDWANKDDVPVFQDIVRRARANGVTGFGAGDGYMQPGSMHLGFGNEAVWGAGGKGANAPEWLRSAFASPEPSAAPVQMASIPPTTATDAIASASPMPAPTDLPTSTVAAPPPVASVPPVQVAQAGQPVLAPNGQAIPPEILKVLGDPRVSQRTRGIAQLLIQQQQARQQAILEQQLKQSDPGYKADLRLKTIQADQLLNPRLSPAEQARIDMDREKFGYEKTSGAEKLALDKDKFAADRENNALTPDLKEYNAYVKGEADAGRNPLSLLDYQLAVKKAGATSISTGEGSSFYKKLDEKNAETFAGLSDAGMQARSKMGQIDRLEGLFSNVPQGAEGAFKKMAGDWGIPIGEGTSDTQAASALIERMVPQQRAPGSGPMSDADIKMFRSSLPQIINQPGGNQLIFQTMRGITQYEIKMGEIADRVANREIEPSEARRQIQELKNPLADFKISDGPTPNKGTTSTGIPWSYEQ